MNLNKHTMNLDAQANLRSKHARMAMAVMLAALAMQAQGQSSTLTPGALGVETQRQLERQLERLPDQKPPAGELVVPPPAPARAAPAGLPDVAFELKGVDFTPSRFFTPAELAELAAPLVGRQVRFAELQQLVEQINSLYATRQIFTSTAVLPAQTIQGGRVRIELVEGKLGQVHIAGNEYVSTEFLRDRVNLPEGEVIDLKQLETRLAGFNRGSSVRLSATLEPGTAFGLTDIQVSALEPKRNALDVFMNNTGFKSTGNINGGMFFRHTGMLGRDDRLSLSYSGAQGLGVTNLSYDVPVGREGTRVGMSIYTSRVRVVSGPFAGVHSSGKSEGWSVNASHPLAGDVSSEWLATATVGRVQVNNYVADVLLNESRVVTAGLGLTYSSQLENRAITVTTNVVRGSDETHTGTLRNDFYLLNGNWNWTQFLTTEWSASLSGAWQYANGQELPSGNMFQLGGASTVRGYAQGALAGDGGIYAAAQLNRSLSADVTGFAFVDSGRIHSAIEQPTKLTGYGVGAQWRLGKNISGDLTLAHAANQISDSQHMTSIYVRLIASLL